MKNQRKAQRFINLTEQTDKMTEEIIAYKGYASFSEMIRAAIMNLHSDVMRESGQMYGNKRGPKMTLNEKRREEEDREEREMILICDQLDGKIEEKADGSKVCAYYTYVGKKRYEQKVSLGLLNKNMINTQYTPSKEAVLKLQKEKKVEY